jgi:hypothetical protein
MIPIHKIKYRSTSSHNKICSAWMRQTIIYLNNWFLKFYFFTKNRVLHKSVCIWYFEACFAHYVNCVVVLLFLYCLSSEINEQLSLPCLLKTFVSWTSVLVYIPRLNFYVLTASFCFCEVCSLWMFCVFFCDFEQAPSLFGLRSF